MCVRARARACVCMCVCGVRVRVCVCTVRRMCEYPAGVIVIYSLGDGWQLLVRNKDCRMPTVKPISVNLGYLYSRTNFIKISASVAGNVSEARLTLQVG